MKPRKVRNAAINAAWMLSPGSTNALPATWPLGEAERARLHLIWPKSYEWDAARKWVEPLRLEMGRLIPVAEEEIPQPERGPVIVRVAVDDAVHDIAIDYADRPEVHAEAMASVALYFKMQFVPGTDRRVVPGGFPPNHERIYRYLPRLRALRDRSRFDYEVYGRFSAGYAADVRARAVRILSEQTRVAYEGGLTPIGYGEYLREVARSRVCIDLPGNGDFCFRLVEYLAVGACVIGPRPRTQLHVPLVHGEHVVHAAEDLSDLVDLCEHYVADDEARERVASNARAYFDRYLHRQQLAGWYLRNIVDRLGPRACA